MELDEREGGEGGWMPRRFLMSHRLIPSVLACRESLVMNGSFSASIRDETFADLVSYIGEHTGTCSKKMNKKPSKLAKSHLLVWFLPILSLVNQLHQLRLLFSAGRTHKNTLSK